MSVIGFYWLVMAAFWGCAGVAEHLMVASHVKQFGAYKGCWSAAIYWYAVSALALVASFTYFWRGATS